jgi:hypothetical protein
MTDCLTDAKRIIEGYKNLAERFEAELNAQTARLQLEERIGERLLRQLDRVREELEIEKRYSHELKSRLHMALYGGKVA